MALDPMQQFIANTGADPTYLIPELNLITKGTLYGNVMRVGDPSSIVLFPTSTQQGTVGDTYTPTLIGGSVGGFSIGTVPSISTQTYIPEGATAAVPVGFKPTIIGGKTSVSGSNGSPGNQSQDASQGGRYTYSIDAQGNITYKKPDGSNCTVTEFRRQAGEQAYNEAQNALRARRGTQS